MKNTITKMVATASVVFASVLTGFAQSNLGADCGCPTPVSSRPTVLVSTLCYQEERQMENYLQTKHNFRLRTHMDIG
ncbi:MAG: hypothetical protein IPI10_15480 [Bacteroidetes bacterium]|nr:hypothetical protein [Bacteroidota bacterium]